MADSETAKPGELGAKLNMVQQMLSEKLSTDAKEFNKEEIIFIAQCVIDVKLKVKEKCPLNTSSLESWARGATKAST